MFKIVETIERGSKKLTIIPCAWERNGELSWPKFRADKLIRVADSTPDDTWFKMQCKLKRNHLINFEVAEEELERMLEVDDSTEQEEVVVPRKKRCRVLLPNRPARYNANDDFNVMASACVTNDKLTPTQAAATKINIIEQSVFKTQNNNQNVEKTEYQDNSLHFNDNMIVSQAIADNSFVIMDGESAITENANLNIDDNLSAYIQIGENSFNKQLIEKLDNILANQTTIIENQNQIIENLKRVGTLENQILIMQQCAKFETMIDSLASNSFHNGNNNASAANNAENIGAEIERIDSCNDLVELERKLEDKKAMELLIEKLSFLCGKKGNGNGLNNCYLLVDVLFTRKFMTICSWAGGARGQKEKIPFKVYKKVIRMFFEVIRLSDQSFTLKQCEEFFKNVIRNSTRRSESGMIRSSTVKRRPKNLTYKIQKHSKQKSDKDSIEINDETDRVEDNEENDIDKNLQDTESDLASEEDSRN